MMDNIVEMLEVMDTGDGYFEYLVFYLMAPDFYLYKWTQLDHEIICHETRLNDKLKNNNQITAAVKTAAKKLNLTPEINLAPDKAEVKIVTFTAHGGFFLRNDLLFRALFRMRCLSTPSNSWSNIILESYFNDVRGRMIQNNQNIGASNPNQQFMSLSIGE